MLTAFKQSLKSLSSNKGRTILTTLGIMIGISTVILVLSGGEGFRRFVSSQVDAFGSNTLFIETRVPPTTKNRSASGAAEAMQSDQSRVNSAVAVTSLKNRDIEDVKRLSNVGNAYGMVVGQKVASFGDTAKNAFIYGASADRFAIDKGELEAGRFYTASEDSGAAQVAVLGNALAADLFGETQPLGQLVRVGGLNFEVIGVYEERGNFGGMDLDQSVFLPLVTAQKKLLGIDYLLMAIVQLHDANMGEATAEDIRLALRKNHSITDPDKDDFLVQTQAQAMDTFNTIFNGITALLIAIAAISLIVGGVGIMNIMYVVVTERTAEIGLKKALGAKSADILYEFLIESIVVTVIGGAIGILFGSFLGFVVSVLAQGAGLSWPFSVPWYAVVLGFGVSAVIGIGFGVLPARSAAKLDPVEALRYE